MSTAERAATFAGLVDLASSTLGGEAIATNDDFFAGMENLVKPEPAVFLPDEYTDRGKWMDGWESRRKRGPGHDWCVVKLGVPGRIRGLDIDTAYFLGNHPPYASLEATHVGDGDVEGATWTEVLPQAPLRPGSQNLFAVQDAGTYTHVRLHIYPDGGVARLRVFGDVVPNFDEAVDAEAAAHLREGEGDLASVRHGGLALACSDAFFGPMNNLISPGRAVHMGGGWESRRRRGPGHDWILIRLGAEGRIGFVEVDTNHFKGNFPDRFLLEGVRAKADARITALVARTDWESVVPETKLQAHTRLFIRDGIAARGPFTHVRLSIYPDGGVSRLRVFGTRVDG